ncbi:hypothetical protein JMN32_25575 [Fulvivirga sp. 29W222]|uniref:DUF5017 domain-containing protein n=1 Tax=Fulvivirga marina TaxID=2494733 RepID=A0A937G3N6_9BACT|nr:hypothetical protein [Fulvivirga marina]MBL6449706.1 hypothetical protein [Fulvivirga marina]
MKNIKVILGLIIAAGFMWSCDPLGDEIDEIKAEQSIAKTLEITLDDDAYELSSDEGVANYKSFDNEGHAKGLIPEILSKLYPALGEGSSATVTYEVYQPLSLKDTIATTTVTAQEYTDLGFTYGNFDSDDDIDKYLQSKYPDARDRDVVDLTYQWYNGSQTVTETKAIVLWNGLWRNSYVLSAGTGDYENLGRGTRDYFSTQSEAEFKIGIYLKELFPYAEAGKQQFVIYNFRDYDQGGIEYGEVLMYTFDGTDWILKDSSNEVKTLKFAHNGTEWVADNTIKFVLSAADYLAIAEAYTGSNPDGSTSMTSYKNYDLSLWSAELIQESLISYLTDLYPPVDGQKYLITYATWEPGAGSGTLYVIGQGGEYILFEE